MKGCGLGLLWWVRVRIGSEWSGVNLCGQHCDAIVGVVGGVGWGSKQQHRTQDCEGEGEFEHLVSFM